MTFRVYPEPPERPLSVAPGATSAPVPIEELVGSGPGGATMFIRFAVIGADCGPPPSTDPTVVLVSGGSEHPVTSVDGVDPTPVAAGDAAFASVFPPGPAGRGVFRLELFKATQQPIAWQIRFRNNDPSATQRYTWVVADQAAETRQPWIDLPEAASVEFTPGEPATTAIRVANLGTGPLTIGDPQGFSPGPGFALANVPGAISPSACAALQVRFTAAAPAAPSSAVYTATSNDTTARQTPGHNHRVALTATKKGLPPGTILVLFFSFSETGGEDQVAGVIQVDPATGEQTLLLSLPPSEESASSNGVTVDANGDILVAAQRQLIRVDPATGDQTLVASGNMLRNVKGIALEADGKILVVAAGRVIRVDPATGAQTVVSPSFSPTTPHGLAVEAGGSILVGTARLVSAPSKVIRVDPATGVQTLAASLDQFEDDPFGVALEANGRILVTSRVIGLVRVDPVTAAQTVVSAIPHPTAVAVEPDGKILVGAVLSTAGVGSVIRVDPRTGAQSTVCSLSTTPVQTLLGIAVVPPLPASPQGIQP
jgi:sugar lactone lactonase YvrE